MPIKWRKLESPASPASAGPRYGQLANPWGSGPNNYAEEKKLASGSSHIRIPKLCAKLAQADAGSVGSADFRPLESY